MRRPVMVAAIAAALFTLALCAAPGAGAWAWPTSGPVLQTFRFDPEHPYAAGQHRGIDVAGEAGAVVRSPVSGSVTFSGAVPASGATLAIATTDGYSVTLTHLGSLAVSKGAAVAEGDVVASVGSSGDAEVDGAYVHLGVRLAAADQGYVDPLPLLPARSTPADPAPSAPVAAPVAPAVAASASPPAPAPSPPSSAADPPVADPAPPPAPEPPATADAAPIAVEAAAAPVGASLVVSAPTAAVRDAPAGRTEARPRSPVVVHRRPTPPRPSSVRSAAPSLRAGVASRVAEPEPEFLAADTQRRVDEAPLERAAVAIRLTGGGAAPLIGFTGVCAAAVALLAAAGLAAVVVRRRTPIMERHALLRHDAHLLRQRPPAHRSLVHDHRGGHPRAPSPPARRGDVLPHRRRRARDQGLARR